MGQERFSGSPLQVLQPDSGGIGISPVVDYLTFMEVGDMCDKSGYEFQHPEFESGSMGSLAYTLNLECRLDHRPDAGPTLIPHPIS